jgi:hypothetical protein
MFLDEPTSNKENYMLRNFSCSSHFVYRLIGFYCLGIDYIYRYYHHWWPDCNMKVFIFIMYYYKYLYCKQCYTIWNSLCIRMKDYSDSFRLVNVINAVMVFRRLLIKRGT